MPFLNIIQFREQLWFVIIYCIHYIFNDFFVLGFNFIIDVMLIRVIRQDIRSKKDFSVNSNSCNHKKIEELNKVEKDLNKMVIYMLFLYLVCRFPELILYIYLLFVDELTFYDPIQSTYSEVCEDHACLIMIDIIQFLYMFSYLINFFFYYRFNKPFRLSFNSLIGRSKARKTLMV